MHAPSRGRAERLQAWIVTGPLGHLWSVATDLALFAAREAQRKLAGAGSRPSKPR